MHLCEWLVAVGEKGYRQRPHSGEKVCQSKKIRLLLAAVMKPRKISSGG
jgi:hypothetical protein